MIDLDSRSLRWFSRRFVSRFNGLAVPCDLLNGDAAWFGRDPGVAVCGEFKGPVDLVDSIKHTGRLLEQIRKAREGGFTHYMLFLHGHTGMSQEGYFSRRDWRVENGKRVASWVPIPVPGTDRDPRREPQYVTYREVDNSLNSIEVLDGVQVKRALDEAELVQQVVDAYLWWQRPIESHRTTTQRRFYEPTFYPGGISLTRRLAKELPGVDAVRSVALEQVFPTPYALANATVAELRQAEGIGPVLSRRIYQAIRKGTDE